LQFINFAPLLKIKQVIDIHEKTAGKIMQKISLAIQRDGNDIELGATIDVAASPRCQLGNRRGKEPDMSLTPAGLAIGENILDNGKGCPFPNIVIEVAYKNEPLDLHRGSQSVGLRDVIRNWLSPQTSVQVVIGIKIFERQDRRYRASYSCSTQCSGMTGGRVWKC
jgi:hypothetical protein